MLAGDNAGWPNGRRPRDDVTDIAVRLVGGPTYIALKAGDGVNVDDATAVDRVPVPRRSRPTGATAPSPT